MKSMNILTYQSKWFAWQYFVFKMNIWKITPVTINIRRCLKPNQKFSLQDFVDSIIPSYFVGGKNIVNKKCYLFLHTAMMLAPSSDGQRFLNFEKIPEESSETTLNPMLSANDFTFG